MSRSRKAILAACVATLVIVPSAGATSGHNPKPPSPRDKDARHFVGDVPTSRILHHQFKLQQIARRNGDTREVFSSGYTASLDYVVKTLKDAGYKPTIDMFNFPFWRETAPPVLNRRDADAEGRTGPATPDDDGSPAVDFITLGYSPTASAVGQEGRPDERHRHDPAGDGRCIDERLRGARTTRLRRRATSRSSCAAPARSWQKADRGAAGRRRRRDHLQRRRRRRAARTRCSSSTRSTSRSRRSSRASPSARSCTTRSTPARTSRSTLTTFGTLQERFLPQVIAETKGGDKNNVLVVGAHLDSVPAGPGINDDGSGTAMLLAQAEAMAKKHNADNLRQKIRFGWWGAEENGLVGSTYYAHNLSDAEVGKIDAMLDYDMLASQNYVRFLYDGDGSEPGNEDVRRAARLGPDREGPGRLVQVQGPADRPGAVRRPLGLRRLHRPRHPRGRHLRRRRAAQDGRAGSDLRRRRRLGLRRLLPRDL